MARWRTPVVTVEMALIMRTEGLGVRATGRSFKKSQNFPPAQSEGWTISFLERHSRYWLVAASGKKNAQFEQGTDAAWEWVKGAESIIYLSWFIEKLTGPSILMFFISDIKL